MECTCVCLSMCQGRRGEWWVGVVARSREYKCIYMLVVNRGDGLLKVAKARSPNGGWIMRTNLMYELETQTNKQTSVGVIDWLFCMLALLISRSLLLRPFNIDPIKEKISIYPSIHPSIRTFLRFFFSSTLLAYN